MKVGILEADPSRIGGIQRFVCSLAEYLPEEKVDLLAYYADLAHDRIVERNIVLLNDRQKSGKLMNFLGSRKGDYLADSSLHRSIALLRDIWRIRYNLKKRFPGGDTLVLNSASAMLLFCPLSVLKKNRIILVQHNNPKIMLQRPFDFGGILKKYKILLFNKYVDDFVMLSPFEKKEFEKWLPLAGKNCHVIRHALPFPEKLLESFPAAVAVLVRLVPQKRIDRVVECAKLLPEVGFNIYGSGPEEENLKKMADGLHNVHFCGYTNDIDLVFEKNSLLLITSDYEGYPIGGIESCIHGRPIVAVNTFSAARDLVDNGINGILLEEYTPEKMAGAINMILKEPEKYQKGALQHRERYNCEIAANKWRQLLSDEE